MPKLILSILSLFIVMAFSLFSCKKNSEDEVQSDPTPDPTGCLLTKKFTSSGSLMAEYFYDTQDRYFMKNDDTLYTYINDSTVLGPATGSVYATYELDHDGKLTRYSDLWIYIDYFYSVDGFLSVFKKYTVSTNSLQRVDSLWWSAGNLIEHKSYTVQANGDAILSFDNTYTYSSSVNYWQYDFIEAAPLAPFWKKSANLPASFNNGTTTTSFSYVLDSGSKPSSMTASNAGGSVTVSFSYSCE
jgi:hypothetical protein